MSTVAKKEEFAFQAEIKQLLHLLSHSLYQSREIAIRELVSNASDALDKIRYTSLTDPEHKEPGPLEIRVEINPKERTLSIVDTGIGMTHDELVAHLGTIAHSGSLAFLNNLSGDARGDLSLIGQFGVGFYSAFMLADRVRVVTRSYKEDSGWEWESDGSGKYSIVPTDVPRRGTSVILHLKEDADEFLEVARLRAILRKYSSFVPHPIHLEGEVVNSARPIWVEPKNKLTSEQYEGFYQHLTHRTDEKPLWHLHLSVDSPIQFHAVLFCPPKNVERLGFARLEHGLYLCAKRVLVQNDCRQLLPEYLRFVYGLVDSEDLPLNVSRETLQDSAVFRKIKGLLVRRVLDRLEEFAQENPASYGAFYREFGSILREGVHSDFEHRQRLAKLLRFSSTRDADPEKFCSLAEYLARAPIAQKQIYYVAGPSLSALERNPNLEIFKKRGAEVLLLTDPIDELLLGELGEFEGRPLRGIDAADVELPPPAEGSQEPSKPLPAGFGKVLELFRTALADQVSEVRESARLTDSPVCLLHAEGGMSVQLEKLLHFANQKPPASKRILEVNPRGSLVERLCELAANPDHDRFIQSCGRQLYANALLLEGQLDDPRGLVDRTQEFMLEAASKRSPLVL